MQRVAHGDHGAFACLVRRHQTMVWRLACRFLGDPHDAEDLTQEAFIRVLQAASRYRPVAAFPAYLTRIVCRLCIDVHRRKRPQLFPELPDLEDSDATPDILAINQERAVAVQSALADLPPNQRLAMILRYYNDYSYREIAAVMEISEKAAERLLSRGRARLAERLAGWFKV